MSRKSVDLTNVDVDIPSKKELFIIKEKREPVVEDFLPEYSYSYEGTTVNDEAIRMIQSLEAFIKANGDVVLQDYSSRDMDAVVEGFQRAIAVTELFIKSLYLGG